VTFSLSCVILAIGSDLSERIIVNQNSALFWLWPFNSIYLRQFEGSPYRSSEVEWFFTVVSCSNLIWLVFICWKFVFELSRRDVQFPPGKNPFLKLVIVRPLLVACVVLTVFVLVARSGFGTKQISFFAVSMSQSIAVGAVKIITIQMFALYFFTGIIFEFGGLGLKYVLSKTFGCFVAEPLDH